MPSVVNSLHGALGAGIADWNLEFGNFEFASVERPAARRRRRPRRATVIGGSGHEGGSAVPDRFRVHAVLCTLGLASY